jgi:hypothetical protein
MDTRHALLRGSAALSLAIVITGSSVLAPSASAAPLSGTTDFHSVANKPKKDSKADEGDSGDSGGGGLSSVPILGDVVNQVKNESPDQMIDDVAGLAHLVVPLIGIFTK